MLLKVALIFAAFACLVGYAQSAAGTRAAGPSREGFERQLAKAGYVKIAEMTDSRGYLLESFELHTPTRPHYHQTSWIYLTSRDQEFVGFDHDESYRDTPDDAPAQ
jgi:hypothetical protein